MRLKWLGYSSRTYQAIRNDLMAGLRTLIPEMTDLSDNNVLVRMIALISGAFEQLHYYLDRTVRESFAGTAQSYRSLLSIASLRGISIPLSKAAEVTLTFSIDGPAPAGGQLIPAGTICLAPGTGLVYRTYADKTIPAGQTSITSLARQSVLVASFVAQDIAGAAKPTATGDENEAFYLPANIVQGTLRMFVDGEEWEYKTSRAESSLVLSEAKNFYVSLDKTLRTIVYVGDGFIGALIPAGSEVTFTYELTQAEAGNIPASTITTIQSNVTLAPGVVGLAVTNFAGAYGGRTIMAVDTLRTYIQTFNLSDKSAVLLSDIRNRVLTIGGVVDAAVSFQPNCTVVVDLLTTGGETLPVLELQASFDNATDSILTMGLTAIVRQVQAIQVNLVLRVNLLPGADLVTVQGAIEDALADFFAIGNRRIGVPVYDSDLFALMDNLPGVDNVEIQRMEGVADMIKIYDPDPLNNSQIDASIRDTTGTLSAWRLIHVDAQGGVNTYQVLVNEVYTGQVTTSVGLPGTLTNAYGTVTVSHSGTSTVGAEWLYYVSYYDGNKLQVAQGVYPQLGSVTFI